MELNSQIIHEFELERATGLEPVTAGLGSQGSTN